LAILDDEQEGKINVETDAHIYFLAIWEGFECLSQTTNCQLDNSLFNKYYNLLETQLLDLLSCFMCDIYKNLYKSYLCDLEVLLQWNRRLNECFLIFTPNILVSPPLVTRKQLTTYLHIKLSGELYKVDLFFFVWTMNKTHGFIN
jgi:hypothetical protein